MLYLKPTAVDTLPARMAAVSMHKEGPSAPNRMGEATQVPSVPSGQSLRRCGDRDVHADNTTVVLDKIEIVKKTIWNVLLM